MAEIKNNLRYKAVLSYDGSRYKGWQRLPELHNTIQQTIEDVLSDIFKDIIAVRASGRTDAGVHAMGQVIDFTSSKIIDCTDLCRAANIILPEDIRINEITLVPDSFHSRYSAKEKEYEYRIDLGEPRNVFYRKYSYALSDFISNHSAKYSENYPTVCITNMKKAAELLTGTQDFRSFTSDKDLTKSSIRTINSIDIIINSENTLIFRFRGNGFLYNMVRILSGTLLECGIDAGNISYSDIPQILMQKDRSCAGPTLPPQGLFLMKVIY